MSSGRTLNCKLHNLIFLLELCICLVTVLLFALSYQKSIRRGLWENGGEEGWNSDPRLRIYYYANYREPPEIPLIWSQKLAALESNHACKGVEKFRSSIVDNYLQTIGIKPRCIHHRARRLRCSFYKPEIPLSWSSFYNTLRPTSIDAVDHKYRGPVKCRLLRPRTSK